MAAGGLQRRFVDWEERFVSHDRGSRVVHYYLRDRLGHQCLAVVGTERSLRHMVYVVCDDFLPLAGLDKSTTSAFKWRARREVVDWLSSFITRICSPESFHSAGSSAKGLSTSDGISLSNECAGGSDHQEGSRNRLPHDTEMRDFSASKGDVVWVGSAWNCRKRLQHFRSFRRNGITISVHDFVYVMTEEKDRHIAHVEDLYEDKRFRKKLRVRWFHKTNELNCRIPPPLPHTNEVFYTAFQQDLSVECVDGVATVLSPEHHESCLPLLPADTMALVFVCCRQFDSDGIKPLNIQEVKGYRHQKILARAGIVISEENSPHSDQGTDDLREDEEEGVEPGRPVRRGPRTARCSRLRSGCGNRLALPTRQLISDTYCVSREGRGSGSAGSHLPGDGGRMEGANRDPDSFCCDAGDLIEILSEDSGLRGCWFKATVLRREPKCLKVRYADVLCEDGKENLEEWIPSCTVAAQCPLGIRHSRRMCIRPPPPAPEASCAALRLLEGDAVDAWWHDGWWEGIVCGIAMSGLVHVFIIGEKETALFEPTDLRASMEWLSGTWAPVQSYPNVVRLAGPSEVLDDRMKLLLRFTETSQNSYPLRLGRTSMTSAEKCESPAQASRMDFVPEGISENHPTHVWSTISKVCGSYGVKDEQLMDPGMKCGTECISDNTSGSLRSRVDDSTGVVRALAVKLEQQIDSVTSESNHSGVVAANVKMKPSANGLKWKVGKKRHRQRDTVSSTQTVVTNFVHEGDERNPQSRSDRVNCDRNKEDSVTQETGKNQTMWKGGESEDVVKPKKHRQGSDSTLKALHGPSMGSSLFIGSIPIANLVMSR